MALDIDTLRALRKHHPAWRLLRSPHAPLLASFLHRVFVAPNVRVMAEADLTELLEDALFALRTGDAAASAASAGEVLNAWCAPDQGWLRKFYKPGTDEAQFDLTPATEKAIAWLASLTERNFVGTESRLLTLCTLLEQISAGVETDPEKRLADLRRRRDEIDADIARVLAGDAPLLDDTAIKERFLQFQQLARELLGDFRQVEQNFRQLDRRVREKIALWDGTKADLLDQIMGERDAIHDSDEGRSFLAFWGFLMSSRRQEDLSERLEQLLKLPAVATLDPDPRLARVHHDWLEAGEHTQRTVAQLSQQLRRFLDDRAFAENRRILEVLRSIETRALAVRSDPPAGAVTTLDEMRAEIVLPLERPLFAPKPKLRLAELTLETGDADTIELARLFEQHVVDKTRLRQTLRTALRQQSQVSLAALLAAHPLQQGLAELLAWLELAHGAGAGDVHATVDESVHDTMTWPAADTPGLARRVRMPRVIFARHAPTPQ